MSYAIATVCLTPRAHANGWVLCDSLQKVAQNSGLSLTRCSHCLQSVFSLIRGCPIRKGAIPQNLNRSQTRLPGVSHVDCQVTRTRCEEWTSADALSFSPPHPFLLSARA